MSLRKQARILSERQERIVYHHIKSTTAPERNLVLFLLSVKAGLRAKEIAHIRWKNVFDSDGHIGGQIKLTNDISKGETGGRIIPLNQQLKLALIGLDPNFAQNNWHVGLNSSILQGFSNWVLHSGRSLGIERQL